MSDMSTDTTTPATDRELVQIEGKARATTVMHWPELVRTINRLRQAEAERDRLREALTALLNTTPEERQNPAVWFRRVDAARAMLAKDAGQ
jgi:hypothetical protein